MHVPTLCTSVADVVQKVFANFLPLKRNFCCIFFWMTAVVGQRAGFIVLGLLVHRDVQELTFYTAASFVLEVLAYGKLCVL